MIYSHLSPLIQPFDPPTILPSKMTRFFDPRISRGILIDLVLENVIIPSGSGLFPSDTSLFPSGIGLFPSRVALFPSEPLFQPLNTPYRI